MNREIFHAILQTQEQFRTDPEQQRFLVEYECLNSRFLETVAAMEPEQSAVVMDYCGALIEMHLRTWKWILEYKMEGASQP